MDHEGSCMIMLNLPFEFMDYPRVSGFGLAMISLKDGGGFAKKGTRWRRSIDVSRYLPVRFPLGKESCGIFCLKEAPAARGLTSCKQQPLTIYLEVWLSLFQDSKLPVLRYLLGIACLCRELLRCLGPWPKGRKHSSSKQC